MKGKCEQVHLILIVSCKLGIFLTSHTEDIKNNIGIGRYINIISFHYQLASGKVKA
jgi:hypothetical protein